MTIGCRKNPHYEADPNAWESKNDNKEIIIKPKGLNIVWGNDSRYWRLPELDSDPVELVQVSWLEVTGSAVLRTNKTYEISFKVSLKDDAFGWSGCPVFLMAKFSKKGKYFWKRINQIEADQGGQFEIPKDKFQVTVPDEDEKRQLFFGLYEIWSGKWKGGLKIHEVLIKQVD